MSDDTPPCRETVETLKMFWSGDPVGSDLQPILDAWKITGESIMQRAEDTITVNNKSQGGRATGGIPLAGLNEKRAFVKACRQALHELDPDTYEAPGYGAPRQLIGSQRPVMM